MKSSLIFLQSFWIQYYDFVVKNAFVKNDIHIANVEALIFLKALAFINLYKSYTDGVKIDKGEMLKHRNDVFRLALIRQPYNSTAPEKLRQDLLHFIDYAEREKPDISQILKNMNSHDVNLEDILAVLREMIS